MLQLKFLHKGYGQKIAEKQWPYFNAYGFFTKHLAPGVYTVDWSTYDGETVEVSNA